MERRRGEVGDVLGQETGLVASAFIKAERNLEALGFFTPSRNGLKSEKEKVIRLRRKVDGEIKELTITILPASKYGLPSTVHQDLYRAFQSIVSELYRRSGEMPRLVRFTTADLLDRMGIDRVVKR